MTLADDVDLEEFVMSKDDLSGADIKVYIGMAKTMLNDKMSLIINM